MMPRPRSRKHPIELVDAADLVADVDAVVMDTGLQPAAIVTGIREWLHVRNQRHAYSQFWPGGEETFHGVPVIVRRNMGKPQVMATQADVEELLLPAS